ncbi:MAG: leucine-rich repeat protein, partial [Tannerella sp.]|nr:leucine-rich repeat protein [Tannerella sp.]
MKTGTCHSRLIHSVVTVCTSLILQGLFCSPSARAEDFSAVNSDNKIIYYNTTSSTTVEVVNGTYTGDLVIPESVIYNGNTYSVTVINNAFNGCSALTSVIIPNSVTDIESKAFRGCTALTSVTIGSSVTFIAPDAFDSCNGSTLTAIYVKAQTPPSAAGAAGNMTNINNVTVHVPCGKAEDYKNWGGFSKITADISPYSITAQSSYPPAGTAAVTKVPNCADNTAVITATPSTGYRFVRWNDGSTSASRTVTVTQDVTYTAIFEMLSAAVTTPGGVNNSNYTWYAWLTPDSYNGSGTWVNNIVGSSSIGNFVKENIAPAKLNTGYNFHPSVEFKKGGSDTWMQSENYHVIGNDHNVTVFIVMRHLGTGGDYDYLLSFYKDTYQNRQFIFTSSSNLRLYWPGTSHNFTFKEGIFALDNTNNSNTTGMASYVNGAAQNLQASGRSNNGTDNKLAIGSRSGTLNYGFDGTIQELIVLKASGTGNHMEAADLRKIHSYLAIKYGITLNNTDNYVNSNGATVWTRTAGYNSQIFGIARDDASGLYQKQSQSIANTVFSAFVGSELYTHNANNNGHLDNGVYAMFGSNNASLNTTVTLATGL